MRRASGLLLPGEQHIAAAERANLAHDLAGICIEHRERLGVGHRQREARALQQRAIGAHIAERGHPRARSAFGLGLGLDQGLAKFRQRAGAEQRRHEQTIGRKRAPDLDERTGKIVDAMERQSRHDQIEAPHP